MVHCYTIPVLIVNFIAMLVVITGCLIGPSWTASRYKEFDMKPSEYFGCNFKRAIIVSLFIAILACISIIIYYIVLCVDIKIGGWAAGVAVFMSFLSFLFNMSSVVQGAQIEWGGAGARPAPGRFPQKSHKF